MLKFLDYFYTIFHSAFVIFVVFGWIPKYTRKIHILALILTLGAWLIIGWYKGVLGYCPLTAWHWDVKRQLGERGMSGSFVGYMIEHYGSMKFERITYDILTASGLLFGVIMSLIMNIKLRDQTKS